MQVVWEAAIRQPTFVKQLGASVFVGTSHGGLYTFNLYKALDQFGGETLKQVLEKSDALESVIDVIFVKADGDSAEWIVVFEYKIIQIIIHKETVSQSWIVLVPVSFGAICQVNPK